MTTESLLSRPELGHPTTTPASPPTPAKLASSSLYVIKRDGQRVGFDAAKISSALTRAILAVEGEQASGSQRVHTMVTEISAEITRRLQRMHPEGGAIVIEDIQDQAELGLMRRGLQAVARAYVLYREAHKQQRADSDATSAAEAPNTTTLWPEIQITQRNGEKASLDREGLEGLLQIACAGLDGIDIDALREAAFRNLYDGIQAGDVNKALIMAARSWIEKAPDYSKVCARLLLESLRQQVCHTLSLSQAEASIGQPESYAQALEAALAFGIGEGLYDEALTGFDLPRLAAALKPERDLQFTYLGLQTLFDRYFVQFEGQRIEMPQVFFMRVAMGLALNESDREARAIEFYELLSSFDYMCSTPTLFNSGTRRPQLSSCYLTTVPDDLEGIFTAIRDNALLSKWAGGLGNDWTPVRGLGAAIKGTNGISQGVVPFLKVINDTAVAVNQGGKRKGAVCAYLETWHIDIEEFLELRKNTGDERRRTHDMNTAHWVPDLFMKRVFEDSDWTLFSPDQVPDLHDLYGAEFERRYLAYEQMTRDGELSLYRKVSARDLWRRMLSMLFETGHPWITFKDACNLRSPQPHTGVVHSSNLCTEITLNTSDDEIAVCNLGSINLPQHIRNGELDSNHLQKTVRTAVRMLDNVIDINYYAVEKARNANLRHRPIGLGIMGFQDALYQLEMAYASTEAVHFADQSMELISHFAIEASSDLAAERGQYGSYEGSLWSQGIFPVDSQKRLADARGENYLVYDQSCQLDWRALREKVAKQGMRNSNVMAIAPTATISNIVGVSQSIEPTYQNLYVKSNLSGEFTVINPALVKTLKALDLWDNVMVNDLKFFDGSVQKIDRIPEAIRQRFACAFEIDARWLVEAAARRQKWIDQAQSLNLYMAEASGKRLDNLYKTAWARGLKTTYYLRSLGATQIEKHVDQHEQAEEAPKVCSILAPDCEACQ